MRDALYHVARRPRTRARSRGPCAPVSACRSDSRSSPACRVPQDTQLRRLRECIAAAEDHWNQVLRGQREHASALRRASAQCLDNHGEIGHTDLKRLGQGLAAIANLARRTAVTAIRKPVAMRATAILLLQNAQENFRRPGPILPSRWISWSPASVPALRADRRDTGDAVPLLDEMTRRAQEKLLIGQSPEIQSNLAQIEQALDGCSPGTAPPLRP